MHSNKKKAARGDLKVVKVCSFHIQTGPLVCATYRCSLESGHHGDHLIRVANEADSVLDSKRDLTKDLAKELTNGDKEEGRCG